MKYRRFEETPAWKAASKSAVRVYRLVDDPAFTGAGGMRNQLQRAALSVPANIAEGFERGTTDWLITCLYYSKGSAGEVRSALRVAGRLPRFAHLKPQVSSLIALCENVGRQLFKWAESLQNSDIKGVRHLNEAARAAYERQERARVFLERLEEFRRGADGASGVDAGLSPEAGAAGAGADAWGHGLEAAWGDAARGSERRGGAA